MAAALRFTARRLGGSALQRTSVELWPKFIHGARGAPSGHARTSNGTKAADEKKELARIIREIQNKTEELYDLSAEMKRNCNVPSWKLLLRDLTEEEEVILELKVLKLRNKTEELYNLSAEMEKNYTIPSSVGIRNQRLLMHLSAQVDPKLDDPIWRRFRMKKGMNTFVEFMWFATPTYLVARYLVG